MWDKSDVAPWWPNEQHLYLVATATGWRQLSKYRVIQEGFYFVVVVQQAVQMVAAREANLPFTTNVKGKYFLFISAEDCGKTVVIPH